MTLAPRLSMGSLVPHLPYLLPTLLGKLGKAFPTYAWPYSKVGVVGRITFPVCLPPSLRFMSAQASVGVTRQCFSFRSPAADSDEGGQLFRLKADSASDRLRTPFR
jgi:hypothetical protein